MPVIAKLLASATCYECKGTGIAIDRRVQTPMGVTPGPWDRIEFRLAVCRCVSMKPLKPKLRALEPPE